MIRSAVVAASLLCAPSIAHAEDPLNRFEGFYAAIGGGYGVGSGRDASISPTGTFGASDTLSSIGGPSANIAVGRSLGLGRGVIGLEFDARWADERGAWQGATRPDSFSGTGTGSASYTYRNDLSAHAALRAGYTFGDTLIYGKAGIGTARSRETFAADSRGITPCLFAGGFTCVPQAPLGMVSATATSWLPSVIVGLGLEQNWGRFFARAGVEFEAVNQHSTSITQPSLFASSRTDQLTWTSRANLMFGVRF